MPNSLLWVCLVAIWLFVLVPMVVKSRPTVRKTSDAALATRVLHRGGRTIAKTKRRMASGRHPHDAEWEPPVREYRKVAVKGGTATAVKDVDVDVAESDEDVDASATDTPAKETAKVTTKVALESDTADEHVDADSEIESDVSIEAVVQADEDVDVADETDDLEHADNDIKVVDADADADAAEAEEKLDDDSEDAEYDDLEDEDADDEDAEYDDVEEADDDTDDAVAEDDSARRARRGGFDPEADRERSDKRYRFRQRVMASIGALAIVSLLAGILIGTAGWVLAGIVIAGLIGYMAFLRRAVRNEQRIFQQRMRRLARARREDEERRAHPEVDPRADIPARLRRPGAIVLEIDDEDPIFDHLPRYEHVARAEDLDTVPSYRRVVGQ